MGTTNSWVYESKDDGATWTRLARLGKVDDLVVDNLLVDRANPRTLYAGVWQMDDMNGGVYISHDGGHTWTASPEILGKSVRSLAQANTNPRILVAGAISGVYRTEDGGLHWKQISPPGSLEIRKIESIAIDPTDSRTIYVGTWHLPWKTTDGGKTWSNIKKGLIVDSDIFSILLDPKFPSTVYMSACSGIYKSDTGGALFRKIQGIPTSARRTRSFRQDPANRSIIYAGTTEGLYKTVDAGATWKRMTAPNIVINDIYIDPKNPQRVLLATDRSGVLASNDGGVSFTASNDGVSQRQVMALLSDRKHPDTMYAGVVNGKSFGGVFVSKDGGKSWRQRSEGLDGRDIFSLAQAKDGTIYAGTNSGIFRLNGDVWVPDNLVVNVKHKTVYVYRHSRRVSQSVTAPKSDGQIEGQVNALSVLGPVWYAATTQGVYRSMTQGATWSGPILKDGDYRLMDYRNGAVYAAQLDGLRLSWDGGLQWKPVNMPVGLSPIDALATTPSGTLWLGGRQGAFYSNDHGKTWHAIHNLPVREIDSIRYDPGLQRVVLTSRSSDVIFAINPDNRTWQWWDAGWKVRMVHSMNGRLVAASLYDGVVVEPHSDSVLAEEVAKK
ncbi:MAG TPA: hypothetical protein VMU92_03595 [Acidobacteriaceae bacterium]|nr:hypothetical protein [Acidobacteriaceae bacterium]